MNQAKKPGSALSGCLIALILLLAVAAALFFFLMPAGLVPAGGGS